MADWGGGGDGAALERPGHVVLEMERLSLGGAQESSGSDDEARVTDVHVVPLSDSDPLVDQMRKRLEKLPVADTQSPAAGRSSICRVPPSIKAAESEAYEPRLVSIGPLHREKESLKPMQELKLAYLRDLLDRSSHNDLGTYVKVTRGCAGQARAQYAEAIGLSEDGLVEMLVLDGCFIIEYFVKRVFRQTAETAPLSGVRWGFSHLRRDLMLLENQIPFFVLVKLFSNSKIPFHGTRQEPLTLMEIALRFLDIKLPMAEQPKPKAVLHLLHLYHLCLNPQLVKEVPLRYSCGELVLWPFRKAYDLASLLFFGLLYLVFMRELPPCFVPCKQESKVPRMINCATELVEAGVHFKKKDVDKSKVNCFLKVSFGGGLLEIPFLKVEESTSSKLRNLIALEQCCPQVGSYITSYAILMDNIINTEGDVAILRGSNIIESKLGSDREVADMFNALCKGTHIKYDDHYNALLFKDVKAYCDFAHHKWRATLVHKYFGNPWTIISLLAGLVLLLLTATQTYFTVFPRKQ
ncbi:hypothetical protein Taro_023822 [Colocasia esculenta]|uniref:Uncharacterized protein n=1 Tax=Colocasia esculenta TaxID=4460 RepID=A0A843UYH4_COLES|nr:hypothetical protein [Colocasia esculenta]